MITGRGVLRTILIWGLVAVFFAFVMVLAVLGEFTALLGFSAFPVVGAIILTSRPGNGVGWYLLGVGIVCLAIMWGLDSEITALVPAWAESLMNAVAGGFWLSLPVIGVLYPSGRVTSRLGRVALVSLVTLAAVEVALALLDPSPMLTTGRANPFAVGDAGTILAVTGLPFVLLTVAIISLMVIDLISRWRRATPLERLQYRWFVFGLVGVLLVIAVSAVIVAVAPGSVYDSGIFIVATLSLNAIPISIGIAITRHGLYEIGRVVSRTVSYAIVTVLVVGVYAIVVTSLSSLLPTLPSVGVALATLAAAALFLPVLRWVQRVVDRRFDRERYDAQKVVEVFGEHLRTGVNPDATGRELLDAVDSTLQPSASGLWIPGALR